MRSGQHRNVLLGGVIASAVALGATATPSRAAQVVDFDASELGLSNGSTVGTWGGQAASGDPTYLTGQTPNGGPAVQFNGADHLGQGTLAASGTGDFIVVVVANPGDSASGSGYHNLIDDDASDRPMLWVDNRTPQSYEFNFGAAAEPDLPPTNSGTGGWDIFIGDSRNGQIYFNSPTANYNAPAVTWNPAGGFEDFDFFNRDGNETFQGQIAEMRVYNDIADINALGGFDDLYNELNNKWIVIPEPGGAALLAGGLGLLAGRRRRRTSR